MVQTRADAGRSTAVTLHGKELDNNKLRRHLKKTIRQARQDTSTRVAADVHDSLQALFGSNVFFGHSLYVPKGGSSAHRLTGKGS